jgi:hypothetical protein
MRWTTTVSPSRTKVRSAASAGRVVFFPEAVSVDTCSTGKPCHHLLYSGGEFVRLYPVNPGQTSNYAAKAKKAAVRAYKSALDI